MTLPALLLAAAAATQPVLPPAPAWNGASRALVAAPADPWITPAEKSGLARTPSYDETVAWLERLAAAAPEISLVSLGRSPEGRDIWMVVAHAGGAATPEALHASGRPVLLAQGGIHAGEIDGKDAGLMLLRDLTVGGRLRGLLESASLLLIPILNVDGHEPLTPYGRINQRGPEAMGWRTNGRNLNLNRDYAKADTPEMQALIRALNRWRPDLYIDLHVTDGVDYQYDITWGFNGTPKYSPESARWIRSVLDPTLVADLRAAGHIPGPLVFAVDSTDLSKGIVDFVAPPRFSNGYGDLRHLPTLLVENHSLKPYDQRVLGTRVFLESALRQVGRHHETLRAAVAADHRLRPDPVVLAWKIPDGPPETRDFLGIASRRVDSLATGAERIEWTGEPVTLRLPVLRYSEPALEVARPRAYWIPAPWTEAMERLALHGIQMERQREERRLELEYYRMEEPAVDPEPFEGRPQVSGRPVPERLTLSLPAGSVRIATDQPLGDLAVALLEPAAPDSLYRWGFFMESLSRTEYVEEYVMAPMAERMLADDPELARAFDQALASDPELAADPAARLQWFYRRTPFFDPRWRLYPVGRELGPPRE